MAKDKFIIEPHFRLQEWVAEEKGYFKDEGLDYVFREIVQSVGRRGAPARRQGRRDADLRARPQVRRLLRLPLDGQRRRHQGPRQALWRCLSGLDLRHLRAGGLKGEDAGGSRRRADLGRLPVRQPLRHDPGARAVHAAGQDQPVVQGRAAVRPHGEADQRRGAGLHAVLRAVLLRRAARLPQGGRLHLHDGDHDHRRAGHGGRAASSSARCAGRSATSTCGRSSTRTTTRTSSPSASTTRWTRGAGGRASASCSSRIRARCSTSRASGSRSTAFSTAAISAPRPTTTPWCGWLKPRALRARRAPQARSRFPFPARGGGARLRGPGFNPT